MKIVLHNSHSRSLEELTPIVPGHIGMYVCGPTVYDRAHLGNARPVIVFDVLTRLLRDQYTVKYVRNITDIDDKIILKAIETGQSIETITTKTTALYKEDMLALGNIPPDIEPLATNHIDEMQEIISLLLQNGHAYTSEGHVLFDVSSNPLHGSLMGIPLDNLQGVPPRARASYKRSQADFVLWKPSPDGWPSWDSPWGEGRPGWHIECSAMSAKYLGLKFDIHGGGADLAFPHHESENAQTTCAHKTDIMANLWIHNGMMLVNGEKMSKSLGNFVTVPEILNHGHWAGEAFRLMVLKTHYRSPMDYTFERLKEAKSELDHFYRIFEEKNAEIPSNFMSSLANDLNTPEALYFMHAEKNPKSLYQMGRFIGLFSMSQETWFHGTVDGIKIDIEESIRLRDVARSEKRWKDADTIRDDLLSYGIILEDLKTGTIWRKG